MNHSIVIAHIYIHDAAPKAKREPQSNLATIVKAEISKFLESCCEGLSKRLYYRSSLRSLLEQTVDAQLKRKDTDHHQPDELTESSATNEVFKVRSLFEHSLAAEVWEEDNIVSVDVTRVSMLQAMEQSPLDSWNSSKLCHFLAPDGLPASSKNITQSKEWWDRPLWAWERNELTLANGAMLAVEMMEYLKPILLPSQKLKVTVSNVKQLPKQSAPGEWSYCIALFGETDGWYGDEKAKESQTESNGFSVASDCDENNRSTTIEQSISLSDKPGEREEQKTELETTRRVESPTESNDAPILKQNIHSEPRLEGNCEHHVKEDLMVAAKDPLSQEMDSKNILLCDSKTSTIAIENIPVTLSPEDSVIENEISQKDALDSTRGTTIDLDARDDQTDLSTTSCVSASKEPPTISHDERKSLITTPVDQCERYPVVSHSKDEHYPESSQLEKTDCSQENKTNTQATASDGMDSSICTSDQPEKLRSIKVSPSSTQEVEEEQNVSSNNTSEGRPITRDISAKSPQFDSQGIDLSMLSQIPQELRSEARLALAVRQPRKTRKRIRPHKDSQLYKWLSSSSSSAYSKVPRMENHILQDKRRPSNIKDFFPAA